MSQTLVIGLGTFGATVAKTIYRMDQEVLAIDSEQEKVDVMMEYTTQALKANAADEEVLKSLGIRNFDAVVIAIGTDIQTSILIAMMVRELGAQFIVARARTELHARVLKKIGVDNIIFPERDTATRLGHALASATVHDVIEFSESFSLVEIGMPPDWVGQTLESLKLNRTYGLLAVTVQRDGETSLGINPRDPFRQDDILTVVGANEDIRKLEKKYDAKLRASRPL